jgi:hypothetical protein
MSAVSILVGRDQAGGTGPFPGTSFTPGSGTLNYWAIGVMTNAERYAFVHGTLPAIGPAIHATSASPGTFVVTYLLEQFSGPGYSYYRRTLTLSYDDSEENSAKFDPYGSDPASYFSGQAANSGTFPGVVGQWMLTTVDYDYSYLYARPYARDFGNPQPTASMSRNAPYIVPLNHDSEWQAIALDSTLIAITRDDTLGPSAKEGGGYAGGGIVAVASQPISSFEWNWGDGGTDSIAAEVLYTDPSGIRHYRMVADIAHDYPSAPGQYIKLRGRDVQGRRSMTLPIRIQPKAVIWQPNGRHWDATHSYGRTGVVTAVDWHFSNSFSGEDRSGAVIDFDFETEAGTFDIAGVTLKITDNLGREDRASVQIGLDRRCSVLDTPWGEVLTAARSEGALRIFRFAGGVSTRAEIAVIGPIQSDSTGGYHNPTLWARRTLAGDGARLFLMAGQRPHIYTQNYVYDGFYSDDFGRSWQKMAVQIWSSGYHGAHICELLDGGAMAVAIQDGTAGNVYVRRSKDGLVWPTSGPDAPRLVGALGANNRQIQIYQKAKSGRMQLEVTNGFDRLWISTNMGKAWTAA